MNQAPQNHYWYAETAVNLLERAYNKIHITRNNIYPISIPQRKVLKIISLRRISRYNLAIAQIEPKLSDANTNGGSVVL
jgi:hypothetical protein